MSPKIKVLILDNAKSKHNSLIKYLEERGFEVAFCNEYKGALPMAEQWEPEIVLMNLILDGQNTLNLVRSIKSSLKANRTRILMVTSQKSPENIKESIKAGANDFLLEPIEPFKVLDRIRYQLQEREMYNVQELGAVDSNSCAHYFKLLFNVSKLLAESTETQKALFLSLKLVAEDCGSPRVNIIMGDVNSTECFVIATSDDENIQNLKTDLERYPEVREVLLNHSIVFVKDITQNPLTKDIKDKAKTVDINSLLVFPIRHRGQTIGTMSVRLKQNNRAITDGYLKTLYMIGLQLGSKVAARKLMKTLAPPKAT